MKVGHKVDATMASNIVKLIDMMFQHRKRVTENGLIALSGLINGVGDKVNITDFGKYVVFALQSKDDECSKLACGIVSDLSNAFRQNIAAYLLDFVPNLINILKDPSYTREAKLQAIVALGDLAMSAGEAFCVQFLPEVLKILENASKKSLMNVKKSDDEDLYNYLVNLRDTLVVCYTTIVHGVNDHTTKQFLAQFTPNIISYLG